jgi:hypothetical protein
MHGQLRMLGTEQLAKVDRLVKDIFGVPLRDDEDRRSAVSLDLSHRLVGDTSHRPDDPNDTSRLTFLLRTTYGARRAGDRRPSLCLSRRRRLTLRRAIDDDLQR